MNEPVCICTDDQRQGRGHGVNCPAYAPSQPVPSGLDWLDLWPEGATYVFNREQIERVVESALDRPERRKLHGWTSTGCLCGHPSQPVPSGLDREDFAGLLHDELCQLPDDPGFAREEEPVSRHYLNMADRLISALAPSQPVPSGLDESEVVLALERVLANFKTLLANKPVRDATETIAEAESALARLAHSKDEP